MHHLRTTAAGSAIAAAAATFLLAAGPAQAATTLGKVPLGTPCCQQIGSLVEGQTITTDQQLTAVDLGNGPDRAVSTFLPFDLRVQSDGNLVEYEGDNDGVYRAVWATGTQGAATPVRLTHQSDGNVVLYDANNAPLWASGTAGQETATFGPYGNGEVVAQTSGGAILSRSGPQLVAGPGVEIAAARAPQTTTDDPQDYTLDVQADGNVVEYLNTSSGSRALWQTGTAGAGRVRFAAQSDGNLVLYQLSTGRAIWQSGTHGAPGYYQLDVQDDANIVLYRTDYSTRTGAVWASYTRR